MKRFARKLALFLLLGAIINVVMAWACAWRIASTLGMYRGWAQWRPPVMDNDPIPQLAEADRRWLAQLGYQWKEWESGWRLVDVVHVEKGFFDARCYFQFNRSKPGHHWVRNSISLWPFAVHTQFGWPCRCISEESVTLEELISQPNLRAHQRFGILWAGFAINTIFYAAILWLLFAFPFALRRRRRIKRGLCPKCAYDLRGGDHAACPECGRAVKQ